jgi:DNA-binding NtrC family response regulator
MSTILIADDDNNIRETLRMVLEEEGYAVVETGDGASTLATVNAATERLIVLLDLFMPASDAIFTALERNPALSLRHGFILCTAASQAHIPASALQLRIPVLHKPFDIDRALALIDNAGQSHLAPVHELLDGDQAAL